jgi:hypothetical protein
MLNQPPTAATNPPKMVIILTAKAAQSNAFITKKYNRYVQLMMRTVPVLSTIFAWLVVMFSHASPMRG